MCRDIVCTSPYGIYAGVHEVELAREEGAPDDAYVVV